MRWNFWICKIYFTFKMHMA